MHARPPPRTREAPTWLWVALAASLVVALPGFLLTVGVEDWRWLAGASIGAAVASVFVKIGIERYSHGSEVVAGIADAPGVTEGCLTVRGRLPTVRIVLDPTLLGVHPAPCQDPRRGAFGRTGERVPRYVARDVDAELVERLGRGGFVLLAGDTLAGKTRTLFEVMRTALPRHVLIAPTGPAELPAAVDAALELRRCVLWLGDLEVFLGPAGLTRTMVGRLLADDGHHRVLLGTIRSAEITRHTGGGSAADELDRELVRPAREVLGTAAVLRLPRMLGASERAAARRAARLDARIAAAVAHADRYGLAEYLAAGPVLLTALHSGWEPGQHPRGAALVAAAIDCRRAGLTAPLPPDLLEELHEEYLAARGGPALRPESLAAAWQWATRARLSTTHLLTRRCPLGFDVFAYLVDAEQGRRAIPEPTLRAALAAATPGEALRVGRTAYRQHHFALATVALGQAHAAAAEELGPAHPRTLETREARAVVALERGAWAEAEAEHRRILGIRGRGHDPGDPGALRSRHNLAVALHGLGRLAEAETEQRATRDGRLALLGADHLDTLHSRHHLALLAYRRGRLDEAETAMRSVVRVLTLRCGSAHPRVLQARNNLANVLMDRGRLPEAEREHRAVLAARRAQDGDDLAPARSRHNLANVLALRGGSSEAAEELAATAQCLTRLLGTEHPHTLAARVNLATVTAPRSDAESGAAVHALTDVLTVRTRMLGEHHPDTLAAAHARAAVLALVGAGEVALAEHRSVLAARREILGGSHPDTLHSTYGLAHLLAGLGEAGEALDLLRGSQATCADVLGSEHPDTRRWRGALTTLLEGRGMHFEALLVRRRGAGGAGEPLAGGGVRKNFDAVEGELAPIPQQPTSRAAR